MMEIALSSHEIVDQINELLHYVMKYYCEGIPFDQLDEALKGAENDINAEVVSQISERGFPVEVQRISVMNVGPKNAEVLTRKQAALERRIAEDRYSLSVESLEKRFELERREAKGREEIKSVERQTQVDLSEREARLRAELVRTYAEINAQFGEAALPVEVQRELLIARSRVSEADLERFKEMMEQVVTRTPIGHYMLGSTPIANISLTQDKNVPPVKNVDVGSTETGPENDR